MSPLLPNVPADRPIVIGMVHLAALPGSPRYGGSFADVEARARHDAAALAEGGVDAIMVENFGDVPFTAGAVPGHTIAHMTALAAGIRRQIDLPLGINVLRNDGRAALAIAHAVGAAFIRVNVLCGARVTDQGIIQGIAFDLLRDRMMLGAGSIRILADVDVKHSAALAPRPLVEEIADTIERGGADAIIISGAGTGRPTDAAKLAQAKQAAGTTPVLVGSGATAETIRSFLPHADGFIVGTSFKTGGAPSSPVDPHRVRELMDRLRSNT